MVAFALMFAISLIASALATPIDSAEISRRALPVGISASTARSYLSECACTPHRPVLWHKMHLTLYLLQ